MSYRTWDEALQMQSKVTNLMTNLNMLINDYSIISNSFDKAIEIQNNKINNNTASPLRDDLYNELFVKYDSLKTFGDVLLNNISELTANLEVLGRQVVNVDEQAVKYIEIINKIRNKSSTLNKISSNVVENSVDFSNLPSEEIEIVEHLINNSKISRGGKTLRKKKNIKKGKKHSKRNKRK
jgi:hypothetical protein